ncbi:MAG: DUF547 domain-containing protein, partial [Nitrospiraceae bacterium]
WMLVQGLRRYGFRQKADSLARDILELPMRFGFYEYFDSFDGRGYGSRDFSWTASLFIDIAYENYLKAGEKPFAGRIQKTLYRARVLNSTDQKTDVPPEKISQEMLSAIRELRLHFYTTEGRVDYDEMKQSDEYRRYKSMAASLRDFDLTLLKIEEEKKAFWINLYNTIVVDAVIASGIRESVQEVLGFFANMKYDIGGVLFSPDDIEHGILRANKMKPSRLWRQFGVMNPKKAYALQSLDARIHFALVCGSRSCAPIKYYSPETVDNELALAAKNFINSSEFIVIHEEKRMLISSIFKWYMSDFAGAAGVIDFIKKYIVDDDKREFLESVADIKVDYLYYDWNLNK